VASKANSSSTKLLARMAKVLEVLMQK